MDPKSFLQTGIPLQWRYSDLYRGWTLVWRTAGPQPRLSASVIDAYDPDTLRIRLKEPRDMKAGDAFEIYPSSANWSIHDNTITGCSKPVVLDSYGSESSLLKNNIISRGGAAGVKNAVEVRGRFKFIGNSFSGFDEPGSAALMACPDHFGKPIPNVYQGNVFERCANVVAETQKGLWEASRREGNLLPPSGAAP